MNTIFQTSFIRHLGGILILLVGGSQFGFAQTKIAPVSNSTLAKVDEDFLTEVNEAAAMQVQISQIALQKAKEKDVKDFASRIVPSYTALSNALARIATSKGFTLNTNLTQKDQQQVEGLRRNPDFDRAYSDRMFKELRAIQKSFMEAQSNGKDADVRTFAAEYLTTVRKHLNEAHKLTEGTFATKSSTSTLTDSDLNFVEAAARGGLMEAQMAETAQQHAQNPKVKQLASQILKDHQESNKELNALAAKKGVKFSNQLGQTDKEQLQNMSKMSGAQFDQRVCREFVEDHEKAVKEYRNASSQAKDPDVRAFASKMLPKLEEHLKMAKEAEPAK